MWICYLKNSLIIWYNQFGEVCINVGFVINNIIGGVFMATSSITKEFTVKDVKAYSQMMKEVNGTPNRTVKTGKPSNIERGNNLLKQFSFR